MGRVEPANRRLRAWREGRQIVDGDAFLHFEDERHPRWAVRRADLRVILDEGDAAGGWATLVVDDSHHIPQSARPLGPEVSSLDLVELDARAADLWLEEEHVALGWPRNPYHRVDAVPSSRRVTLSADGEVVASTDRPVLMIETAVPPRWYIPPGDVDWSRFVPASKTWTCQYKGDATYFRVKGTAHLVWTYRDPYPEVAVIAGMLAAAGEEDGITVRVEPSIGTS